MSNSPSADRRGAPRPFAIILGANEIASATAVHLHRKGYGVVICHDPSSTVIRRKMSFYDALFDDTAYVDGVAADRANSGIEILDRLAKRRRVIITTLGLLDLIVIRPLDLLVDARMQKAEMMPDLRRLAGLTIGLGPGFCAGGNCDAAIETHPSKAGEVIARGAAMAADGIAPKLGTKGGERFVYTSRPGRWHTPMEIGARVFKDYVIGRLAGIPVRAPFDGVLRGLARDGSELSAGAKLIEIDPRGRRAAWSGMDSRGRAIASGVVKALALHKTDAAPARAKETVLPS
jgi:hypothetical protein